MGLSSLLESGRRGLISILFKFVISLSMIATYMLGCLRMVLIFLF